MPTTTPLSPHRIPSLPPSFYYIPNFITPAEESHLLSKINSTPARWKTLSHRRLQVYPTALSPQNVLLGSDLPTWLTAPILRRLEALGVFTTDEDDDDEGRRSDTADGRETEDHGSGTGQGAGGHGTPHAAPNHCLVNEYAPGQGIMPHEDGDAYAPVVATVSLGSHGVLDLYPPYRRDEDSTEGDGVDPALDRRGGLLEPVFRILQEPCSLLVTRGRGYGDFLHGIAEVDVDVDLHDGTVANWGLLGNVALFGEGRRERGTRVSLTFRDVKRVSKVGSKLFRRR